MSKIRICNTAEIPTNGMKDYDVEGGLKVLIANAGDCYYAYQGICPHQDVCLAEGYYDGAVLTCHQHLWQWDITTGKAIGLAEAPLEKYEVKVEDGEIFVLRSSALKASQLFMDISDDTLQRLDQLARREEYESGSTLYNIGDPTDDLYILESGRVEFLIGRDGTSPAGFVLHKGEVFGWAALLEHQPRRIAKATCLEKSALLRLNGEETLKVLESDPVSGYLVMRKLSSLITRHLGSSGEK
ncbi:MAG: cyclic nucleotide-binding domain-containing protein [Anaerolineales bacterium]|nr:cyclic nucleotide-binding domain-containing protein [Anaerolineales bacterium]